jgi:hypothetical protein
VTLVSCEPDLPWRQFAGLAIDSTVPGNLALLDKVDFLPNPAGLGDMKTGILGIPAIEKRFTGIARRNQGFPGRSLEFCPTLPDRRETKKFRG